MYKNIAVLTGAGISAESGIATFRDSKGLWSSHRIEDVATPEGYARNPDLVHKFYNSRRKELIKVEPNNAHYALARLEKEYKGNVLIITQNVDNLHERAGSKLLVHMHGELIKLRCLKCAEIFETQNDHSNKSACPHCANTGSLRPHIVWFGEIPMEMDRIEKFLSGCDLFISIGTSGEVYPAAGFVRHANAAGAHTVELNLEQSKGASLFAEKIYGKAGEIVPVYVEKLLEGMD